MTTPDTEGSEKPRMDKLQAVRVPWGGKEMQLVQDILRLATVARTAAQTEIVTFAQNGQGTRPVGNEDTIFQALLYGQLGRAGQARET